jgi:hypothetical protein
MKYYLEIRHNNDFAVKLRWQWVFPTAPGAWILLLSGTKKQNSVN